MLCSNRRCLFRINILKWHGKQKKSFQLKVLFSVCRSEMCHLIIIEKIFHWKLVVNLLWTLESIIRKKALNTSRVSRAFSFPYCTFYRIIDFTHLFNGANAPDLVVRVCVWVCFLFLNSIYLILLLL